jgi:hypothetical protein
MVEWCWSFDEAFDGSALIKEQVVQELPASSGHDGLSLPPVAFLPKEVYGPFP